MKVKICNLLRATTYLQLLAATLVITWFGYDGLLHSDFAAGTIFWLVVVLSAALQATFAITVVRLMHYYAPVHRIPDPSFLRFYSILAGLNIATGLGSSIWFAGKFMMLLRPLYQHRVLMPPQLLQLSILGSYTIIVFYTIAGAAKLKRAVLQRQEWQLENWLENIDRAVAA